MKKYKYITINETERMALLFMLDYLLSKAEINTTTLAVRLTLEELLKRSKHKIK